MSTTKDFNQILLEKMNSAPSYSVTETQTELKSNQPPVPPSNNGDFSFFSPELRAFFNSPFKSSPYATVPPLPKSRPPVLNRTTTKPKPPEMGAPYEKLSTASRITLELISYAKSPLKMSDYIYVSQVRAAFRRKARELHPDLHPEENGLAFAEIKEAYDSLLADLKTVISSSDT